MAVPDAIGHALSFVNRVIGFGFVLANLFFLLVVSGRIEKYWLTRRRSRRVDSLRERGIEIADLQPYVEYAARHDSVVKPLLAAVAAVALGFLATRASDTTFLATSYAITGAAFLALAVVELVRYRRARRLMGALIDDPDAVATRGQELFPFVGWQPLDDDKRDA